MVGKDTLLPASGSSKQPDPSTLSPDREVPAFVIAAAGVILQDTFRLLQVGPSVQAVPTAPTEELSCCNRLCTRRWQLICEATYYVETCPGILQVGSCSQTVLKVMCKEHCFARACMQTVHANRNILLDTACAVCILCSNICESKSGYAC